jgi:putative membrane protein
VTGRGGFGSGDRPYRRLSPLTPLVRGFILVIAVLTASWDDLLRGTLGPVAIGLLLLLVGGAVYGTIAWAVTKYWIEADELRVDTGVVRRQSRRIRIDRLQGVDIVQPFIARLFGLAELRMDVAGGAREGSLAFMRLGEAQELKDLLLARRDAARSTAADEAAAGTRPEQRGLPLDVADVGIVPGVWGPGAGLRPGRPEQGRLLARVDHGNLALSILLSSETLVFAAIAVFLLPSMWFLGAAAGAATLVPVFIGFVLVQFRNFTGNYNFTVLETEAGTQVRRGMFDLRSQTIALSRIQGVVLSEHLLWRLLGWARVDVSIAGYSTAENGEQPPSVVMPVAGRAEAMQLVRYLLGGVDPDLVATSPPPRRSRWLAPVARRFMAAGADHDVVVSREGWLNRKTHVVPHARVQSLSVSQGPLQRLLDLADVELDSPPGPVNARARHRPAAEARTILEREVEVSRQARLDHAGAPGGRLRTPGTGDPGPSDEDRDDSSGPVTAP